ncbi:MAG: DUF1579 family protein [Planctomycetes bacterium]|nr:DUF1579 family protein [Planctomycetota bacterium]
MFTNRFFPIFGVTLMAGIAIATATRYTPFQESPKVEEHNLVLQGVGEWEGTLTMFLPGQEEPMVAACTETVAAVGDLWTVSQFKSNFGGMPFSGSSTFGFDTDKQSYVCTWVDSTSTRILTMYGRWHERSESVVSEYQDKDPITGEMVNKRTVWSWNGDRYACKFYDLGEKEVLTMTIEMKRKKLDLSAVAAGRRVYEGYGCVACHGEDGAGNTIVAKTLTPSPRNHTDSRWQNETTDEQIRKTIVEGRPGTAMVGYPNIKEKDVDNLIAFIRSLKK